MPFVETAPPPVPTEEETRRGFVLFTRPITEPVHPNTHPLPSERLTGGVTAFATPEEWESVTLSVYPLRNLENFRVQVSGLAGPGGATIDASRMTVRLQTYWNMGYPRYTSRETFRRVPELLERVDVHSSPAGECQRWWIQIHVPRDAAAGVYQGTITLRDDRLAEAVTIPLSLRVLGFPLQQDPAKHFSTYFRTRDRVTYEGKDESFYQQGSAHEFRTMREYGIDQFPTLTLTMDKEAARILVQDEEVIERLIAAGMTGRIPVLGGNVIGRIYHATTPEGKKESHWAIDKMPPPEFYEKVNRLFREFEKERAARGWPPMICCPIDEVAASSKEFGIKVYKAVHDAGFPTYITKSPSTADAPGYAPHVDVWCSQPFAARYEEITAQDRHEYWSYPNHVAGERKNRRIMCKGGRMTYGFGLWRSGYTTLIPWHWSWTMPPDPFDYLRSSKSGCGMRIDENAEVIPAIYWECFREGCDDARYLYTLQQAVFEREGTSDPECATVVAAAKAALQETWDAIRVQELYLSEGMWPSAEFDARRWRLATMTRDLLAFPAVRSGDAPSVLVGDTAPKNTADGESVLEQAIAGGAVIARDVGENFADWKSETPESGIEITPDASPDGKPGLRWSVKVDHQSGESPEYPVGWPRIRRIFKEGELDLSRYDYLEFMIRIDSDRDEVADDATPFGLSIRNHGQPGRLYETRRDLGDRQREWIPLRYSLRELIDATALGAEPWKNIQVLQLFIAESEYRDQTSLTFDIGSAKLLSAAKPLIAKIETSRFLLLPATQLPVGFEALGMSTVKKGSHTVTASLVDKNGKTVAGQTQDLVQGGELLLDTKKLAPGDYTLKLEITTASGEMCSTQTQGVTALAGPFVPATL